MGFTNWNNRFQYLNSIFNLGGKMITRLYNPNPIIAIYDLDNTIIDSEHRQLSNDDGSINLEHWFENCTEEKINKDTLLPLYNKLVKAI